MADKASDYFLDAGNNPISRGELNRVFQAFYSELNIKPATPGPDYDFINEKTLGAGVTVDGVLLKDGSVSLGDGKVVKAVNGIGQIDLRDGVDGNVTITGVLANKNATGFKAIHATSGLTADRTITFQDADGIVAFLSDVQAVDTLSELLASGNTTAGNDILISEGDNIDLAKNDLSGGPSRVQWGVNHYIEVDEEADGLLLYSSTQGHTWNIDQVSDVTLNLLPTGGLTVEHNGSSSPKFILNDNVNSFSGSITQVALSANRTWTLPDVTGTIALTSDIAANNELSEILNNNNSSGTYDLIMDAGQKITTDTIKATTAAGGVTIVGADILTGAAITITDLDSLTTGNGISLISNSADTGNRNLAQFVNLNALATGAVPLFARQTADGVCATLDQNGNGVALRIDSEATTASVIDIEAPVTTIGTIINISTADALTTGAIADFASSSSDATARSLMKIENTNILALGAIPLSITQAAIGDALFIDKNDYGIGINIDADGNSANDVVGLKASAVNLGAGGAVAAYFADGSIGVGVASPDASAILDITSTTQGVLMPRMTAVQGSAITGVNALVIYVTSTDATFTSVGFWGYEAGAWTKL